LVAKNEIYIILKQSVKPLELLSHRYRKRKNLSAPKISAFNQSAPIKQGTDMKKAAVILFVTGAIMALICTPALAEKGGKIKQNKLPEPVAQPVAPTILDEPQQLEVTPVNQAESAAAEQINWQVLSGGGGTCSAGNFRLGGTLGQLAAGKSTAGDMSLSHGFWQVFGTSDCDCHPGDPNNDGIVNIGDPVFLINYIWREGAAPIPYALCSGDAQADCFCNVGDAVYIINYIFREGPYPYSCEQWLANCGPVLHK